MTISATKERSASRAFAIATLAAVLGMVTLSPASAQPILTASQRSFAEDFSSFRGLGFVPSPASGQLDSDFWSAQSYPTSDALTFVERTGASSARGTAGGPVATGGIYAFDVDSRPDVVDWSLGIQPSNDHFNLGRIGLRVVNGGIRAVQSFAVAYDFCVFNDQASQMVHYLGYGIGGVVQSPTILDRVTPADSDPSPAWSCDRIETTITATVPVGQSFELVLGVRTGDGGGQRDQIAFDDIAITANFFAGTFCGDGLRNPGEACDDGNVITETHCAYGLTECVLCSADCSRAVSGATSFCGDDRVDFASGETCDDGNAVSETECAYGEATCEACADTCRRTLFLRGRTCGDGTRDPEEACDDGNTVDESACPYGQATCTTCRSDCRSERRLTGNVCGDGVVAPEESCDDGNTITEIACPHGQASCTRCSGDCSRTLRLVGNVCGDGVVAPEEACDDGNTVSEVACPYGTATCVGCNAGCTAVLPLSGRTCGDGITDPEEVCDDGNDVTEAACPYGTQVCNVCAGDCQSRERRTGPTCGDGSLDAAYEACDDGNTISGDGCDALCRIEPDAGMADAGMLDGGMVEDASVPEGDGGMVEGDAGMLGDAGFELMDGGLLVDGGGVSIDGGAPGEDAGAPTEIDGGSPAASDGGCRTGGMSGGPSGWLISCGTVLALASRRRRDPRDRRR